MHDNNKKFGIALADENLIDDFEKIGAEDTPVHERYEDGVDDQHVRGL